MKVDCELVVVLAVQKDGLVEYWSYCCVGNGWLCVGRICGRWLCVGHTTLLVLAWLYVVCRLVVVVLCRWACIGCTNVFGCLVGCPTVLSLVPWSLVGNVFGRHVFQRAQKKDTKTCLKTCLCVAETCLETCDMSS